MALDRNVKELDITGLIEFIDNPLNQASIHHKEAVDELNSRNVPITELNTLAKEVNKTIAYQVVMQEGISKEEVSMHESQFLNADEIKEIYIGQMEQLMKDKDQFRFDVWSYAIGG